jgi:hypothetical protein
MSLREMTQAKHTHSTAAAARLLHVHGTRSQPDWRQIMVRQEIEDVASDVHPPMLKVESST